MFGNQDLTAKAAPALRKARRITGAIAIAGGACVVVAASASAGNGRFALIVLGLFVALTAGLRLILLTALLRSRRR